MGWQPQNSFERLKRYRITEGTKDNPRESHTTECLAACLRVTSGTAPSFEETVSRSGTTGTRCYSPKHWVLASAIHEDPRLRRLEWPSPGRVRRYPAPRAFR